MAVLAIQISRLGLFGSTLNTIMAEVKFKSTVTKIGPMRSKSLISHIQIKSSHSKTHLNQ